nr:immunoglobulin heavy chain junction region [Mus musculus]
CARRGLAWFAYW